MTIFKLLSHCLVPLVVAGGLVCLPGCGQQEPQSPPANETQAHSQDDHDNGHAHGQADQDEIASELAKLSPEDRALAEQQKICPVAGEPLGSMGVPVKLNVAGRDVFICCAACEESLREEPEKYFSKLDNREQ